MSNHPVIAIIAELWPKRFAPGHLSGIENQLGSLRIGAEEARVILQQVWVQKGRYATPAVMLEALKQTSRKTEAGEFYIEPSQIIDAVLAWGSERIVDVRIETTKAIYSEWLDAIFVGRSKILASRLVNDLVPCYPPSKFSREKGSRGRMDLDWSRIRKLAELAAP